MAISIPFNRPSLVGRELDYVSEAVRGGHASANGPFTERCQAALEQRLGAPRVLLTTSCTDALEMCALLLDLQPGDEVILPSFTFVSTANAFALRGARLVFAEVRADTLNIDEAGIESLITDRTRAIVVVHYAGVGCEMDTIAELAARHDLAVIEDNAHGLSGTYRGRPLGGFGALATLSFHETKNVTCGEGGALIINDERLIERAETIWAKGTDRASFLSGRVDRYTWVDLGSSFQPSDILAAFLLAQLDRLDDVQMIRERIWRDYASRLSGWAERCGARLPVVPEHCGQAFHLFYLLCPTSAQRDELIAGLRDHGILAVFHYVPLHLSPMAARLGCAAGDLPLTEDLSGRLVRLPFYNDLSASDQARVCDAVETVTRDWAG